MRASDVQAFNHKKLLHTIIDDLQSLRMLSKNILKDIEQQGELSPDVTNQLSDLIKQLKVNLALDSDADKMHLIIEGLTTRDHILYKIIQSVFDTLATTATDRIKKCEHAECYLHFVDTSKSGKRRWCSMELCGNRQKAAEFYARKKKKSRS
ncbi:CGNR zinc finger domain-containing protein [Amphibacillus jilinensis]|uniref:CGNR zinc finger domain-containing protein n=1 Tax=Amphibacillus jilinensis TaxID=1216008 RepID=UPI000360154A|nr:CGNR zinc finger domain-containing protein [Amphibacillus jilinensis]